MSLFLPCLFYLSYLFFVKHFSSRKMLHKSSESEISEAREREREREVLFCLLIVIAWAFICSFQCVCFHVCFPRLELLLTHQELFHFIAIDASHQFSPQQNDSFFFFFPSHFCLLSCSQQKMRVFCSAKWWQSNTIGIAPPLDIKQA